MAILSIDAAGWSAQYSGTPPTFTPDTAPETVSVSRPGFNESGSATTYVDALVLTARVREPYPNQATLTGATVALSDYVYSTDTISGVTNNSAEASPKPIVNWITPHRKVLGNTIGGTVCPVEVVAFHRNARNGKQVPCVVFKIGDGTNTVSVTVSASSVSAIGYDKASVVCYALPSTDISSLTAGLITVNAEVPPWIGGSSSVAKSATDGAAERGFSPRYFLKNTTLAAAPPYAYVSSTGNDSTGLWSTSAAAAAAQPFLTVVGAINAITSATNGNSTTTGSKADGCIIRLGAGTFGSTSTTTNRTQNIGTLTIERDPNVALSAAIFSLSGVWQPKLATGFTSPIAGGHLTVRNLTLTRSSNLGQFQGAGTTIHLEVSIENVAMDYASHATTFFSNTASSVAHAYYFGVAITNYGGSGLAGGVHEIRCVRGVAWEAATNNLEGWLVVGCDVGNIGGFQRGTRSFSGAIHAFNKFRAKTSATSLCAGPGDSENIAGYAFVQNLVEYCGTTTNLALGVSNDAKTGSNSHVIIHNNTFTGFYLYGRQNLFYDEGTTARTSKLHSLKGNIHTQINTKGDVFRGVNESGADASSRTGNWAYLYGVGCVGEFSQYIDAGNGGFGGSFAQAYGGLGAKFGTSATVRLDPLFVNYQGTTNTSSTPVVGVGGGDYSLQASSPAANVLTSAVLSHDLVGTARPATNDAAGAYTLAASDTPPTITSASEKAGQVGEALSYTITATGTEPITFGGSGTLPDGLVFDGTATISGTPTTAGVRVATITATNSAGEDSDTLTFTIAAAPPTGDEEIIPGEVVRNAADTILLVGEDRVLLLPLIPGEEVYDAAGTLLLVGEIKGSPPPEEN